MQQKQTFTNFEQKLFSELAQIHPTLTVRTMSRLLGKSEGYWSSICSQGASISVSGLKNLYENIECKKIIHTHDEALVARLIKVQALITQEVVHRFCIQTDTLQNVWHEISETLNQEERKEQDRYGAMPFVFMSRYR